MAIQIFKYDDSSVPKETLKNEADGTYIFFK